MGLIVYLYPGPCPAAHPGPQAVPWTPVRCFTYLTRTETTPRMFTQSSEEISSFLSLCTQSDCGRTSQSDCGRTSAVTWHDDKSTSTLGTSESNRLSIHAGLLASTDPEHGKSTMFIPWPRELTCCFSHFDATQLGVVGNQPAIQTACDNSWTLQTGSRH